MIRAAALALALLLAGPAAGAVRTAIVIGNGAYSVAPLPNAERDARLVADSFRGIGFRVVEYPNVTSDQLDEVTAAVERELSQADIGIVYFVGHAVQYEGVNHLLPVDLAAISEEEIEAKKLPLARIIEAAAVGNRNGLRLFLIDACRTDPFTGAVPRIRRGLSLDQVGTAETAIAYATAPGELASDGPAGSHGPYALALSQGLARRGTELSALMRQVRGRVREATEMRQVPWVSSSVENEYWLNPTPRDERLDAVAGAAVTLDTVIWSFLQDSASLLDLNRFASFFSDSEWYDDARARIETLRALGPSPAPEEPAPETSADVGARVGAPIPAELFRVERERLGRDPYGMAQIARPCDWLTADFADPQRVAPAVRDGEINLAEAAQACSYALLDDPDNARFKFQLGRVLDVAGRDAWARHFYTEAARRGYSAALTNLGYIYQNGIGVEPDYAAAMEYYRGGAALGNLRARVAIGVMFLRGIGVERDEAEAVQWFRLASETGWVNAQNALGDRYAKGEGVAQQPETAVALYELASLNGQRNAMHNLGRMLIAGEGVEQDVARGVEWLERGVEYGSQFAPFTLARHLMATGEGAENPERVFELLRLAARRSYPRAWLDIARLFDEGRIVERDAEAAYANARRAELTRQQGALELADRLRGELAGETVAEIDERIAQERRFNGL